MKVAGKKVEDIETLIDFILYGDIHEVPLSILGEHYEKAVSNVGLRGFDEEQKTRLAIAASVKKLSSDKNDKSEESK